MTIVNAIYKNGTFQLAERLDLPEDSRVRLQFESIDRTVNEPRAMDEVYEIMSRRFRSGRHDLAERHNEHQP